MKKDKRNIIITISIMSAILVCVMFMQFKVVNETDIAQLETMRKDELEKSMLEWKDKYEEAYLKLLDTNDKINEYDAKMQNNSETEELLKKELSEAKTNIGLTDITGEGIVITLVDSDEMAYEAEDILELVNELKNAGAEAISINDERIINISDIVDISSKYIRINSRNISSPYIVKVIGDERYLKSALTIKNGYYDMKIKNGYLMEIEEKNNIKVNKYSKSLSLRYIKSN